jgi:uncharacterized surface protein with fasciclin (FAS1) repeats
MKPFFAMLTVLVLLMLAGVHAIQTRGDVALGAAAKGNDAIRMLRADGHYKILVMALEDSGVAADLGKKGPMTFFAPSDEAFQKVPKLAELLHDGIRLQQVLRSHLVTDEGIMYADLAGKKHLSTQSGRILEVKSDGRNIDDAHIDKPNMTAGDIVIHGIDKVLMEDNDSKLRQAGETLEEGAKLAGKKTYDGLKMGAQKVKDVYNRETSPAGSAMRDDESRAK